MGTNRAAVYFPMASTSAPVGYARLRVGGEDGPPQLPLHNFDVRTVGEAWAGLHQGALWPAVPPHGTLRWQAHFLGPRQEIEDGRLRGKSAHLAVLLAVALWRAGALDPDERDRVRIWASGELDREGRLLPVENLEHKLRLFVEHQRVHGGPGVFVAPAANRSVTDVGSLAGDRPVAEQRFDPARRLTLPTDETPLILWVNRGDVGALLRRLGQACQPAPHRARRIGLAFIGTLGLAIWAILAWPGLYPGNGGQADGADLPPPVPAVLDQAPFVLSVPHRWQVDPARLAQAIDGARIDPEGVVSWEEALDGYRQDHGQRCGSDVLFPREVRLRYAVTGQTMFAGVLGNPAEALAALGPMEHRGQNRGWSREERWATTPLRTRVFDPRHTVLATGLISQMAVVERALGGETRLKTRREMGPDLKILNRLDKPVFFISQLLFCVASTDPIGAALLNFACPQADADRFGSAERSYAVEIENPIHSWIGVLAMGDTENRLAIELDGESVLSCSGPGGGGRFWTDRFPERVALHIDRRWSKAFSRSDQILVADRVRVRAANSAPHNPSDEMGFPSVFSLKPGWSSVPEVVLIERFSDEETSIGTDLHGDTRTGDGRLNLVRTVGQFAGMLIDLPHPLQGAFRVGVTVRLLNDQSLVALCLIDRTWSTRTCVSLSSETQNGSNSGVLLACDRTSDDDLGSREAIRIQRRFRVPAGEDHRVEVERSGSGSWSLFLDGQLIGSDDHVCLIDRFDSIRLLAGQDSSAGHGGSLDDLIVVELN